MSACMTSRFPAPEDPRMAALRQAFQPHPVKYPEGPLDIDILNHCIGLRNLASIPPIAQELAEHIIVISIDTEHWSNNTQQMTEIGMANFRRTDMMRILLTGNLGPHGENMMSEIKFYLFRIKENSHLSVTHPNSRGVNGNRFGLHRFTNFEETRATLTRLFNQPILGDKRFAGINHPVVILGHAVGHDQNNLMTKELAFDLSKHRSIIRYIDTQRIVRDVDYWLQTNNEIGLAVLTENLGFAHQDPHTACNDISHTVIAAFQLALRDHPCKRNQARHIEQVILGLETTSRNSYVHIGGSPVYCWKCGSDRHMKETCNGILVPCCRCMDKGLHQDAMTHIMSHCKAIADEGADEKRRKDRQKRNERKAEAELKKKAAGAP